MKKLILLAVAAMLSMGVYSQNVTREGNTFVQTSTKTIKDTMVTNYKYRDSKGKTYSIIINKANGRCYIWKKSSKTGKMYRQYMKADISQIISRELHIVYKSSKK